MSKYDDDATNGGELVTVIPPMNTDELQQTGGRTGGLSIHSSRKKKPHIERGKPGLLVPDWKNQLYCGDCLNVLDRMEDGSVDLIYIDPPFYSQRYYEMIWGDDAERFAFDDRWRGGIQTYINYLAERVRKLYDKLKPTGTLYVHLDWHISHYMKVELDKICGYSNFKNEIIWCYRGGGVPRKDFARKHDTILRYSKSNNYTFNVDAVRIPYSESVQESPISRFDKSYRTNKVYEGYRLNKGGKHPEDWWMIQPLMPSDKTERLKYPTQKPLTLLNRIVLASSNPGDLVLDAFCGCGTTLESSQTLGRRWVGIDISQSAIRVVQDRVRKIVGPTLEIHGLVDTEEELRAIDPFEFQNWAINAVQGRHSTKKIADMGIDGFTFLENHPIQVKRSDNVGRPVIDNFSGVLRREKDKKGMVIGFSFTRGAQAEVARLKRESGILIELITCAQLLRGLTVRELTLL